jgi:hypothetical protein
MAARAAFSASRCWRLLVATTGRPFDLSVAGAAIAATAVVVSSFCITFIIYLFYLYPKYNIFF